MMVQVEELVVGDTFSMMGGVVRVASVHDNGDKVVVGISIGRLNDFKMPYDRGTRVEKFDVPADVAPWYGV